MPRRIEARPFYQPETEELRYLPECPRVIGKSLIWISIQYAADQPRGGISRLDLATGEKVLAPARRFGIPPRLANVSDQTVRMIVRATSLGDVHSMMLYPVMSSHREISPRHRELYGEAQRRQRAWR